MRASSLSNLKIIDLLNSNFVPVVVRNGDYRADGDVPADEKAAYQNMFRGFYRLSEQRGKSGGAPISVGTVHAYVLSPAAEPLDSLHVAEAARPDRMIEMLERSVKTLGTAAGDPIVAPVPRAAPPAYDADSLALHMTARYVSRNGNDEAPFVPTLGTERSGQWGALPSEEWVVLDRPQWSKLLPAVAVAAGDSWPLDRDVTGSLLRRFYPPSEDNNVDHNRIDDQSLVARVISVKGDVALVRLDGRLKMKHPFYPGRDDEAFVSATLLGYAEIETTESARAAGIRRVELVTVAARYGDGRSDMPFGVAVRSARGAE
jgi:hypothetical protein